MSLTHIWQSSPLGSDVKMANIIRSLVKCFIVIVTSFMRSTTVAYLMSFKFFFMLVNDD